MDAPDLIESSAGNLETPASLQDAGGDPGNDGQSEVKVTRSMEIVVIVACAFVFLMFAYVVVRYIRHGHEYSSMDQNQSSPDEGDPDDDEITEPVRFIEARTEKSFNDPSWTSSTDLPVVIVSVGEDGKASLGYAEESDVSTELVRKH